MAARIGYPLRRTKKQIRIQRAMNDEIATVTAVFEADEADFVCECGDLRCEETVTLTLAAYRASAQGTVVGHA